MCHSTASIRCRPSLPLTVLLCLAARTVTCLMPFAPMGDRLPYMLEIVYPSLVVAALALAGWVSVLVVYRLLKSQG